MFVSGLEKFGIDGPTIQEMRSKGSLHSTIDRYRNEYFEKRYPEILQGVAVIQDEHRKSLAFRNLLRKASVDSNTGVWCDIKAFVLERNKGQNVAAPPSSRTIVLCDATGSMTNLLEKAKNTVAIMFERSQEILVEKKMDKDCFQLQFACYRNYSSFGSMDNVIQDSEFSADPQYLRAFMNRIRPAGGQGNEAVEMGLHHANLEASEEGPPVSQIILIGDMPPNTDSEIRSRRPTDAGFKKCKWGKVGNAYSEAQNLAVLGIPVHAFHVAANAEADFKKIAAMTNGESSYLDIHSSKGAELLTGAVTKKILASVGGAELVKAYEEKWGHTVA